MWSVARPDVDSHQLKFFFFLAVVESISNFLKSKCSNHLEEVLDKNFVVQLKILSELIYQDEDTRDLEDLTIIYNLTRWHLKLALVACDVYMIYDSDRVIQYT